MRKSRRLFPAHMSASRISGATKVNSNPDDPRYDCFAPASRKKVARRVFEKPHPDPYPMALMSGRSGIPAVDMRVKRWQGDVRMQGTEKFPGALVKNTGKIKIMMYFSAKEFFFEQIEIIKETTEVVVKGKKKSIIYKDRMQAMTALENNFIRWMTFERIEERPPVSS